MKNVVVLAGFWLTCHCKVFQFSVPGKGKKRIIFHFLMTGSQLF